MPATRGAAVPEANRLRVGRRAGGAGAARILDKGRRAETPQQARNTRGTAKAQRMGEVAESMPAKGTHATGPQPVLRPLSCVVMRRSFRKPQSAGVVIQGGDLLHAIAGKSREKSPDHR